MNECGILALLHACHSIEPYRLSSIALKRCFVQESERDSGVRLHDGT